MKRKNALKGQRVYVQYPLDHVDPGHDGKFYGVITQDIHEEEVCARVQFEGNEDHTLFDPADLKMVKRPCIVCHMREAEVPDRNVQGRPIKKVCGKCHAGRLSKDFEVISRRGRWR